MKRKKLYALLSMSLLLFWACPDKVSDTQGNSSQISDDEMLGSLEVNTNENLSEGLITFCSGEVYLKNSTGQQELFIGDPVTIDDTIETSFASYCEIQFGDTAIIRVEEETILSLTSVFIGPEGSNVDMDLKSGAVLCKVEKLLNKDDSFKVKTDTAVCGVRGTQFSVSKKPEQEMILAVKEGTVAVVPPAVDDLQKKAGDKKEVVEIVKKLEDTAVLVTADEQIEVKEVDFTESNVNFQEVAALVDEIILDSDTAKIQQLEEKVSSVSADNKSESMVLETKKVSLSQEKSEQLSKTEDMKMLEITAKPKEENTVQETLYKFSVSTFPEDAMIYADDKLQGQGSFSQIFYDNETVSLTIKKEGFKDFTYDFSINEKTARRHTITLIPIEDYEDADETSEMEDQLENENPVVEESTESSSPEDINIQSLEISVKPADAEILIDGTKAGTGSLVKELPEGESLTVEFKRDGFVTEEKTYTATSDVTAFHYEMTPRPIEKEFSVPQQKGIGKLLIEGKMVYGVNSNGVLFGVDTASGKVWTRETANKPNENSSPVLGGDNIYLSGVKELVSVNKKTGALNSQMTLSGEKVHLFGRRVLPKGNDLLFPGNVSLIKLNSGTLEESGSYPIPGGSRMTPAIWKDKILIANQKGALFVMNSENGSVEKEIQTRSIQPVAVKVNVYKDYAVFCGRKGMLSAVNVSTGEILWERNINGTIYHDIAMSKEGCFVFVNNSIMSYSWKSGEPLFSPIRNVSCAPFVNSKNQLVYGSEDNKLIIANSRNGNAIKTLKLSGKLEVTPVEIGGKYIAGKVKNKILFINPEGIVD